MRFFYALFEFFGAIFNGVGKVFHWNRQEPQ